MLNENSIVLFPNTFLTVLLTLRTMNKLIRVLVIGQTPPPFHGQALSIQDFVENRFSRLKVYHIRMAFSHLSKDVGTFRTSKIIHLFVVFARVLLYLMKRKVDAVYYPPTDAIKIFPLLRDIALLFIVRSIFPSVKIIFVFHAAGISEYLPQKKQLYRYFGYFLRKSLFSPDGAIEFSEYNPPDGQFLKAKRNVVIYGGIEDKFIAGSGKKNEINDRSVSILFAGSIREDKGVTDLLQCAVLLAQRQLDFKIVFIGEMVSYIYETFVRGIIEQQGMNEKILFPGLILSDQKWEYFNTADIFCFPSFAPFESFPRVTIEAMMYGLPVVATSWRGIQSVVDNGVTGFLVPINKPEALSEKLEILIKKPELRNKMGKKGRDKFLKEFTREIKLKRYEEFFLSVCNN